MSTESTSSLQYSCACTCMILSLVRKECMVEDQQRGFPLRKYFIPGCVGRGVRLGSESLSGAGGVWKSEILPPWDWSRKTRFSNSLAHNRANVSGSWAEIDGVHTNFSRSIFPFMFKNNESGWNWDFEVGELFQDLGFSETMFLLGFERWDPDIFQNLEFPKVHVPCIQNDVIVS